jgi:hypothetical protein
MFAKRLYGGMIPGMTIKRLPIILSYLLGILLVVACRPSTGPATAPPPAPSPTTVSLYADTTRTVATRSAAEIPTTTTTRTASSCQPVDTPIQYDITAALDYTARTLTVEQRVFFQNYTGQSLGEIVLYVAPNKEPGVFSLLELSIDGQQPAHLATLEGVRLSIPLTESLPPDCSLTLNLAYALTVPRIGSGYFPRQGYLGYGKHQLNLGHWTPTIAFFKDGEWLTPAPSNIGEQNVTPAGDYTLALLLRNAPDDLMVAGPGTVEQHARRWTFTLPAARDITLSLSTAYDLISATTANGQQVEVYTLPDAQPEADTPADSATQALTTAVAALELFEDLYGPYPYDRLVIVESEFPDGMEFSGLTFVGGEWFRSYNGNPAAYLTLITAHEVAHQWWYNLVANDQSSAPWLDEALCIYSEYVFLQENYPDLVDWWWNFRINAYSPQGYVDASVYEFDTLRGYINAVYLRGAQLMHALRTDIGTEAFFDWLRRYGDTMRGQIAEPLDLWNALTPEQLRATTGTRVTFFRQPYATGAQ